MAIGDAVHAYLGVAEEDYRPASGVEVQISLLTKNGTTAIIYDVDGTDAIPVMSAASLGDTDTSLTRNMSWMITNSHWCRKQSASNNCIISGVITNV